MRIATAILLTLGLSGSAIAADPIPDLKGDWTATFDFVVYGNNHHHPGGQAVHDAPRSGAIDFTFSVEGQDGRRLWGESWSKPDAKEPFAWMIAPDNKTIIGSDTDGVFQITLTSADSIQLCYSHPGTSPTGSIVASCGVMARKK